MEEKTSSSGIDLTKFDPEKGFFDEFPRPSKDEWKEKAEAALKGAPFDKVMYNKSYNGFTLEPIYLPEDIKDLPHLPGRPGAAPYFRGTLPGGFLQKPWTICQKLTEAQPEAFNTEARYDLERGQTGLFIGLDTPTMNGDDPSAETQQTIGRGGLSLATGDDLKKALKDIDPEDVYILCATGETSLPLLAAFAGTVQGRDAGKISACFGADPLGTLAKTGSLNMPMDAIYNAMQQAMSWAAANMPGVRTVFIQGNSYHNAGASAVEETAFVLATAAEYIREMLQRGISINTIASQIKIGFSLGSDFFGEIARLRAVRILWTQLITAFGGDESAATADIHGETSAFNKTVYDPYVNMLRVTSEGFSGAAGSVDSMTISPFDTTVRTPDRFSRRIARNVQIILQNESRFVQPIDMAGGSYYIETITDKIAGASWEIFQKIEAAGGMSKALADGMPHTIIAETAKKRTTNIQIRKDVILGTNMYANMLEKPLEPKAPDYAAIEKERMQTAAAAGTEAQNVSAAMKAGKGAVEAAIEALNSGATLGAVAQALGKTTQPACSVAKLEATRTAAQFEELRQKAEKYVEKTGKAVQIFPANMGPLAQHKARLDFSKGFFEVSGFEIMDNDGFATAQEAADAALASGASIFIVCSTDKAYPEYVPDFAKTVKAAKPEATVLVAGKQPADVTETFKAAGVDDFIHVRANCYEINKKLQDTYMEEA